MRFLDERAAALNPAAIQHCARSAGTQYAGWQGRLIRMERLCLGDRQIEYRCVESPAADAVDLVMLHEGLGSVAMWKDFPEALAAATGCRTWVYSRFGYGASSPAALPRAGDYMHEEARDWLPAVVAALGIRRPILFGHSDGASIALIHAAMPIADITGVVALAPHVMVEDVSIESIRAARVAYETADLKARLSKYHADVDSAFWGWNNIWLDPKFRDWTIESMLPAIRVPVLAIQGRDDEYGTLDQVERIRRALAASEILVLDACGHSPHRDQPAAVLSAARRFIEQTASITAFA